MAKRKAKKVQGKRAGKRDGAASLSPRMANAIEVWPIERLKPYERNARTHGDDQVDAIAASIARFGFNNPVLVDGADVLIAGHGRLLAALQLGLVEVPVVVLDHMTDAERRAYILADNRLGDLAGWDDEVLARELREISGEVDVGLTGFSAKELEALERDLASAADNGGATVEEQPPPAPPHLPVARDGDTWRLGDHLVTCGDTMDPEVVRAACPEAIDAVFTDPPYAIYGSSSGLSASVTDDKIVRPFFREVLRAAERVTREFAQVYVCCDWRSWPSWWEVAKGGRLEAKNLIIWDKGAGGLGNNYANTYEAVGFFTHMPPQRTMRDARPTGQRAVHRPNIVRVNRVHSSAKAHNAAKPVALCAEFVRNSTDPGDVVADLFLGSGSTLIACEELGRRCFGIDIEPGYIDVTVERWQTATGKKATLEPGGATFDQVREERAAAPPPKAPRRRRRKATGKKVAAKRKAAKG